MSDDTQQLLAELDELIRTAPPRASVHLGSAENISWLGRCIAVLNRWHSSRAALGRTFVEKIRQPRALDSEEGYFQLLTLLHEGRHVMQMATGSSGVAISQGRQFEYFDEIRKKIEEARQDLFIIDPYLDAEFVSRYLVHVGSGVTVRLLTSSKKLASLLSALKPLTQQTNLSVEVRTASGLHDRYFFVDRKDCYQSGASFKDGAKNAPTTITQITDVFKPVEDEYGKICARGRQAKPF